MTIIQPTKNNIKYNIWIGGLIFVLVGLSLMGVFTYNHLVNVRHEIDSFKVSLRETEVENAELKNELFALTNNERADEFSKSQSLVIERNPEYVKRQQLVSNN